MEHANSQPAGGNRTLGRWCLERVAVAALTAEALLLAGVAASTDFTRPGDATRLTICGIVAGAAYWVAVRTYLRATFSPRMKAVVFWSAAIGLRVLMLSAEPGDDFWRYRWEGTVQLHGVNPYVRAPNSPVLIPLRDADWSRVNHRDYAAIYPPAAELVFVLLAAARVPPLGMKLIFTLADLGVIVMLRRLLLNRRNPPRGAGLERAAAWYAWNPLVVYSFAGGGHYDSLMLVALVAAAWTLDRATATPPTTHNPPPSSTPRIPAPIPSALSPVSNFPALPYPPAASLTFAWVSSLWLGLAIALKLFPVVLLPTWFFALGWRRALLVLPFALVCLPVAACVYGYPHIPIFNTLKEFAYVTRLNDAFWWLVELTARPNPAQKNGFYQRAAFVACGLLAIYFRSHWRRGLLWVLGAMLLLSPVLHPWYLTWILPFAIWRAESDPGKHPRARAWLLLSVSMFGYYLLWDLNRTAAPWREPLWLRLLIYVPPCVCLLHPLITPRPRMESA